MARWEPNAVGRLLEAAMELYRKPGYDAVTVAELAAHAGVTRRTFFRYFPDKREVLFYGADKLEALVTEGVREAPEHASPLAMVAAALARISQISDEDPVHAEYARRRHAIIKAHAELRERELAKHATLAAALTAALRERGVEEPGATLAAEAGLLGFRIGFERWVDDPKRRKMSAHVDDAMRALDGIVRKKPH